MATVDYTQLDYVEMYHDAARRVGELEQLNSLLAEQIDRQRPVIEAARRHLAEGDREDLLTAVLVYERDMAQLNKGERE